VDAAHRQRPACDAIETLAGAPAQATSFLGQHIQAIKSKADAMRLATLIAKLDDDKFAEREMATGELEKLGLDALPLLRRTAENSESFEARQRAQRLVKKLENLDLTPDQRRLQAVLHVFELIASDETRKLLDELASGKAGAWLAGEAEGVLKRMKAARR
jgi:hypothetical protein